MSSNFEIIDVTLRDGSNAVNYQFSAEDTANIVRGLEAGGIKWTEVGHGLGLGATERTAIRALHTDEEYILAAKQAAKEIKIGCFFIHTIGNKNDIDKAADCGLDFLRVGPNPDMEEIRASGEFIEYAKGKGLIVHCCIRKAYALTPDELARQAKAVEAYGTDAVTVMDSAGTLLPNQTKEYLYAIKDRMRGNTAMEVGYHAHDNLSLAVACSLAAVEAGADYIDSCLKGLGRSAGNAPTEILVAALKRLGHDKGDCFVLQDLAEAHIAKKTTQSLESTSLSFGYAGFHSGFYGIVERAAREFCLDPRTLVLETCKVDRINPTEKLVMDIARQLAGE